MYRVTFNIIELNVYANKCSDNNREIDETRNVHKIIIPPFRDFDNHDVSFKR